MIITADIVLAAPGHKALNNSSIVIRNGVILAIGPIKEMRKRYRHHRTIECTGSIIMPGLVNVHAHLELPPLLPKIRSRSYTQWVLNLLRCRAGLDRADYAEAAHLNVRSLLKTGTTTVAEISTYDASPAVLRTSGIRGLVYHEVISLRPGDARSRPLQRSFRNSSRISYGLSPHSPHTTSAETVAGIRTFADRKGLPVCMHVAETADEGKLLRRLPSALDRLYNAAGWQHDWAPRARSSFEYLARMGILNTRFLAVHAVHTDTRDRRIISRTGTAIAHCPRSNALLRVGTLPLKRFLDNGITVGLGTDSLASVATLNLWDEMRFAFRTHRSSGVTACQILELATAGGAKALGLVEKIGTLETGKQADLIVVPKPRHATGNLCSDLLRETKSCSMTMVNGRILYRADDPTE